MNGWEIGTAFVVLVLIDVWLFWYAAVGERKRWDERVERMRRKGKRGKTYAELHYERKSREGKS